MKHGGIKMNKTTEIFISRLDQARKEKGLTQRELAISVDYLVGTLNVKKRQTNADRIRNMSDEELAEFLCKVKSDYQWMEHEFPSEEEHGEWEEWLQSEAK